MVYIKQKSNQYKLTINLSILSKVKLIFIIYIIFHIMNKFFHTINLKELIQRYINSKLPT